MLLGRDAELPLHRTAFAKAHLSVSSLLGRVASVHWTDIASAMPENVRLRDFGQVSDMNHFVCRQPFTLS